MFHIFIVAEDMLMYFRLKIGKIHGGFRVSGSCGQPYLWFFVFFLSVPISLLKNSFDLCLFKNLVSFYLHLLFVQYLNFPIVAVLF